MLKQINLVRIVMMLIIVLTASIFIPDFYWKANKHELKRTGVYFSPISKSFFFLKSDVHGVVYTDPKGKIYSRDDFEQLIPFVNFRQLMLTGKLPDSLYGVKLIPKEINLNNVTLRVNPLAINSRPLQLYPLIESASGRVRLELPLDYFRISNRMEFVTSSTNEINEKKSRLFTSALTEQGFKFPSKFIYGNPSTKKPFDEGYFVIDSGNNVFHIKMIKGKPFCKKTKIPSDLGIAYMAINEYELREFYGVIVTNNDEAFLISYDHYKLIKLPVEGYNHQEHQLQFRGDLFYRIIVVYKENGFNAVITDRNYKVVDRYGETKQTKDEMTAGVIASYLFPFTTVIEKDTTPFVNFYFTFSGLRSLILTLIMLGASFLYLRKKNLPVKRVVPYYLLVLLTGIYGFIALLIVRDFDDDPGDSK